MPKQIVHTDAAPKAIGTYSQAVRCGQTVYLAGQIGLDPQSMEMVAGVGPQVHRVFQNLQAVARAAGGDLKDIVKLTVYLTDLGNFALVNEIMATYFAALSGARCRGRREPAARSPSGDRRHHAPGVTGRTEGRKRAPRFRRGSDPPVVRVAAETMTHYLTVILAEDARHGAVTL